MSARELFERHPANPILTAEDWPYPVNAVFNPAAADVAGETVLLARVEDRRGISHLTVARSANGVDRRGFSCLPVPDVPGNHCGLGQRAAAQEDHRLRTRDAREN